LLLLSFILYLLQLLLVFLKQGNVIRIIRVRIWVLGHFLEE
jgi:hypothetical protein